MMPEYDLGTCQEHVLGMTFLNMTKLVRTWQWNRSGTCHAWNMTAWIRFSIKLRPFHGGSITVTVASSISNVTLAPWVAPLLLALHSVWYGACVPSTTSGCTSSEGSESSSDI